MIQKLKIAFWDPTPPFDPSAGGIASYIRHRAWILGQRGFEVWWANEHSVARWAPEEGEWKDRRDFPVGRLRRRLLGRWPALSPAWRYLAKDRRVDLFELQAVTTGWLSFQSSGPSIILQCHTSTLTRAFLNRDSEVERHIGWFKSWAVRNLNKADGILACSNEIAMLEAGYYHLHPDRITILPHAFSRQAETGLERQVRQPGDNAFLVVGNVEYFKGLDLVLRGFGAYRRAGGTGKLWIAGCGGMHELYRKSTLAAVKPAVDTVLKEHGAESISFLGKQTKDQLAALRVRITAIICGSRFEALTMVAGEAFLSGCPLILSERTGWRALAERYHAARLVNPYEPKDIAAAMREMEDSERRKEYERGGDKLADYLTSPDLAEETANYYRRISAHKTVTP
jgi:glycosyltransferase involved in cell wall biosynthesis